MTSFDTEITRRHTGSTKWDCRPDLDPYWIADMDFTSPPEVMDALHQRINHGVFGYALPHRGHIQAVTSYLARRFGVTTPEEHLVHLGGLVPALSLAARAFANPGDALLTCTPSYPPFLNIHNDNALHLTSVDHTLINDQWTFDWQAIEKALTPKTKLFILSNPQNPLGRVFTAEEITQLATFCLKHNLVLVSDEIHCDLILDETKTPHFSTLNLPEELSNITITLLAPSKTYNIAGLGYSLAVIPDDSLRRRFQAARGHTLPEINCLAYYAAEAAYNHGEPWRQELLAYLRKNREILTTTLREKLPGILIPNIEATYLAWLDTRPLGIKNPAELAEKAGLFLSDGAHFGHPGCLRINFGTQSSRLQNALNTFIEALS